MANGASVYFQNGSNDSKRTRWPYEPQVIEFLKKRLLFVATVLLFFNESLDRLWFKKCKLILIVNHFPYFKKRVPEWGRRRLCQCQATQSCWLSAPACISLIWQPQTAGSSTGQITGPLGVLPRRGCSILISSCCRLMKCCRRYRAVQIIELKRCFCVSPRPGTAQRDGFRIDASV